MTLDTFIGHDDRAAYCAKAQLSVKGYVLDRIFVVCRNGH